MIWFWFSCFQFTGNTGCLILRTGTIVSGTRGTINVESELKKGTTFHITIPLQPVEENSGVDSE